MKVNHIPEEIDIENMMKNICDLGYAAEEQYRRNSEVMRRMLEAKEQTEKQLEEERERRIAEGGIIWPVWSWITSGSQPGDLTTGRTFSGAFFKIIVFTLVCHEWRFFEPPLSRYQFPILRTLTRKTAISEKRV